MMSYTSFSFYPLSIRTSWVTVLSSAFVMSTASSGRNSIALYGVLASIGLYVFHQPINTIYLVSDVLFGTMIVFAGLLIKSLWVNSLILMLEREESDRQAMQTEIKIFEALESFIPSAIRKKIKEHISEGESAASVIESLSQPSKQHLAILYSDFRDYSKRSGNIDFIKYELVESSAPIIELAESYDGIIQNRGDSILATFIDTDPSENLCRALLSGLHATKREFERIQAKGRKCPDRYMIVTSGEGVVCSLGNASRQEITIAGKPVNLAARLDELTKKPEIKHHLENGPTLLIDFESSKMLKTSGIFIETLEINLKDNNLEVRSYETEKRIFIVHYTTKNIETLSNSLKSRESHFRETA